MDILLIILVGGSLVGVYKAIEEMRKRKDREIELREKMGDDYDLFIEMRNKKKENIKNSKH
ncbi:MAG TPA: hypothetical protein DEQ34_12500 [Balneolaceae bacterium]|nr:hypothetical protein [Balneolaceae bacterium]|tara:strand:- start:105104 stop:105286 length:183 start_codon:yes stop_codon:yes gene_type:complete